MTFPRATLGGALLCCALLTVAQAPPGLAGEYHAVLVGISDYGTPAGPQYATNDVDDLRAALLADAAHWSAAKWDPRRSPLQWPTPIRSSMRTG